MDNSFWTISWLAPCPSELLYHRSKSHEMSSMCLISINLTEKKTYEGVTIDNRMCKNESFFWWSFPEFYLPS